eukprot:scpid107271/ scgid33365/ 
MPEGFASDRLQVWLEHDTVGNTLEERRRHITNLIMPERGKSSSRARQSMANGEGFTTGTMCWKMRWSPTIPKCQAVPKFALRQSECVRLQKIGTTKSSNYTEC